MQRGDCGTHNHVMVVGWTVKALGSKSDGAREMLSDSICAKEVRNGFTVALKYHQHRKQRPGMLQELVHVQIEE